MSEHSNNRKIREGIVVSDKMTGSVVVLVERKVREPLYKKIVKKSKKYMVDNKKKEAEYGDFVEIIETKPLSKNKCWRVNKILKKAKKGE
ncbi:30S ribosomal protein S17 [Candidatus Dependentiae bacterium]|nr:30S ribosomal protein S17 [Candidatus Dependentiae bacterium]